MTTPNLRQTTAEVGRLRARRLGANVLAASGAIAIGVAYLQMFTVLGESAYAVKFENGEFPAGFDASGGRTAMTASVVAMLIAVVVVGAAARLRMTWVVGVVATVGCVLAIPYVPLAFVTWQLAF